MVKSIFKAAFAISIAILFSACAGTKMDYATMVNTDTKPGPNIHGTSKCLPKNSVGSRLSGGIVLSKEKRIKLDVENESPWDSVKLDARYHTSYLPVYGAIDKFRKGELFTMQVGFGIADGIYAQSGFGINTKYMELGIFSFQRFTYQNFKYVGYEVDGKETNDMIENADKLVAQLGAGAFGSIFLGPITLGYNGNIYRPQASFWLKEKRPDFGLGMPYLFTNNFSVSFWATDDVEVYVNTTNLLVDFNGGNWSFAAGVSIWSF